MYIELNRYNHTLIKSKVDTACSLTFEDDSVSIIIDDTVELTPHILLCTVDLNGITNTEYGTCNDIDALECEFEPVVHDITDEMIAGMPEHIKRRLYAFIAEVKAELVSIDKHAEPEINNAIRHLKVVFAI